MAKKKDKIDYGFLNEAMQDTSGYEALNQGVASVPFIKILQSKSPQIDKLNEAYDPDAIEGELMNSVTGEYYEPPLRFVVGKFERYYIEWKPNRKGLAAIHSPESIEVTRANEFVRDENFKLIDPKTRNTFSDTYVYYVLLPDFIEHGVCVISLSSTQLKEAKRLNRRLLTTFLPGTKTKALPHFMVWEMHIVPRKNDEGAWYGIRIDFDQFVTPDLLENVVEERKGLPNRTVDLALLEDPTANNENTGETPF